MDYKNDYSLLRPFDLKAAMQKQNICDICGGNVYEFLGEEQYKYSRVEKNIAVRSISPTAGFLYLRPHTDFRMLPLAWVERKPVYEGDLLYWRPENREVVVKEARNSEEIVGRDNCFYYTRSLSWQKPKTKRDWVDELLRE